MYAPSLKKTHQI